MVEEVLPGIYRIEVPLLRNPLRALNSYLIKGQGRSLLVDTGFNWPACRKAMLEAVRGLGVDWPEMDFFITHMHGDHCGLVYELATEESMVYCSRTDARLIREVMTEDYWREIDVTFARHGFPVVRERRSGDFIKEYISGAEIDFRCAGEGDVIGIGDYRFICVMTPGHTPGHVCLYEPDKRVLISGDHILADITSNITNWIGVEDSLGDYLQSLDRIGGMEVELVLPGHRGLIRDCRQRIEELKLHHQKRLDEVLAILKDSAMTAYQVAGFIDWDINLSSWDEFPIYQKWFATGEAISHLEHLVLKGRLRRFESGRVLIYQIR